MKRTSLDKVTESIIQRGIFSKTIWTSCLLVSSLLGIVAATKLFFETKTGNPEEYAAELYSNVDDECRQFGMDQNTGQCLRPGVKLGILEVNSDGVWGKEITPKMDNVYRIGCFGASTTAGNRSIDDIDAWPEHLQEFANELAGNKVRHEVINFGVASTSSRFSRARFLQLGKKYELDMMIFDCGVLWADAHCNILGEKNDELLERFLFGGNESLLTKHPWFKNNLDYWKKQRDKRIRELLRFSSKEILDDEKTFLESNSSYVRCFHSFKENKANDDCNKYQFDEKQPVIGTESHIFSTVPLDVTVNTEYARNIINMVTYALDNNIKPVLLLNLMGGGCMENHEMDVIKDYYEKCNSLDLTPVDKSDYMNGPVKRTMEYIGSNYNIPVVNPFRGLKKEEICKKFSPVDFMHLTNEGYKELAKTLIPAVVDASKSKSGGN